MNNTPARKSLLASLLPIALALLIGLAVFFFAKNTNNEMVELRENVKTAWSQVENQYQRRLDLIPNLVRTVQGYAAHERETLEKVIEARAKATSVVVSPDSLQASSLQAYQDAQSQLGSALSRLMLVVERYPDLKASQTFSTLQAQLEGTENRIAVERKRFNEAAQAYNVVVRSFPANLIASLFGFDPMPCFKAESGAESAPTVDFSKPD